MTSKRRTIRIRIQKILDEYGALATLAHEIPLCDAIADAITELTVSKPRKKQPPQNKQLYYLARALSEVCVIDWLSNKPKLFAEAKRLAKAAPTPTPELIKQHYGKGGTWYNQNHWGKRGSRPGLGQVRTTWAQLVAEAEPTTAPGQIAQPVPYSDAWYDQQMADNPQLEAFS